MARLELERGTDVLLLETGDSLLLEPNDPIVPATLALAITTYAPIVEVTDTSVVTPSTLALTINTFAPAVLTPQTVTPTTLALTITAYVPTIELPIVSAPSLLELSITTYAPTVSFTENVFIIPTTATITLTTYAPIVTATDTKVVTPSLVELVLSTFAPTATVSSNILVTPTTAILTLLAYAPTVAFLIIYPTDAITRVTSIVHQYRNALINNGRTEYKCLVQLGGLAQFSGIDGMTGVGEGQQPYTMDQRRQALAQQPIPQRPYSSIDKGFYKGSGAGYLTDPGFRPVKPGESLDDWAKRITAPKPEGQQLL